MFATTNFKKDLAWAWALLTTVVVSATCMGQEDSLEDTGEKPQTSVFDRLFSSGNQSSQASKPKPKPKVPATAASGKPSRSGFLIPLKSFSKAFRGPSEAEIVEEFEETAPPRFVAPRIPREPFRNLPRVQERLDNGYSDLTVKQFATESTVESLEANAPAKPAPIVKGEGARLPTNVAPPSSSAANTSKAIPKPLSSTTVVAGSSKSTTNEMLIETNSTSRRTAMDADIVETSTPNRTIGPSRERANAYSPPSSVSGSRSTTKPSTKQSANSEAKSLVDLGQANDNTSANLVSAASRDKSPKPSSSSESAPMLLDVTKNQRPSVGGVTKLESPTSLQSSSDKSVFAKPADTKSTASMQPFHREMSVPGVKVDVTGPNAILVDEEGSYQVTARNEGAEVLNGLIVQITVPSHVKIGNVVASDGAVLPDSNAQSNTIMWEIGQIPAGSARTATMKLATPKAEHFALGIEWTLLPQNAEMKIDVQQPQLAIALEGPSEVTFGKPQMYRIRVRNTGNAEVKAVSVAMSAEPYGSNQTEIGDVPAGSERMIEVELTFQQAGTLPISATATSAVYKLEARSAIDVQVRQSELVATWFGPAEFYQGSVVDYELEVINKGSIPAVSTNCSVKLPIGAEVIALPPGGSRSGDIIKWEVRNIEPQEKVVFPIRLTLSKIGENQLVFTSDCSSAGVAKAEFRTVIDAIADLHLTVVDPVAPAPVGQPVVYEIVIANRGKKTASDVNVLVQFSEGIEPVRIDGHTGRIVPGQAIFNSIPSIGSNDKLVLRVHAEASKPGVHRFRVEVKSQGSDTDLLEEESTRYLATGIKADRR